MGKYPRVRISNKQRPGGVSSAITCFSCVTADSRDQNSLIPSTETAAWPASLWESSPHWPECVGHPRDRQVPHLVLFFFKLPPLCGQCGACSSASRGLRRHFKESMLECLHARLAFTGEGLGLGAARRLPGAAPGKRNRRSCFWCPRQHFLCRVLSLHPARPCSSQELADLWHVPLKAFPGSPAPIGPVKTRCARGSVFPG